MSTRKINRRAFPFVLAAFALVVGALILSTPSSAEWAEQIAAARR